MTNSFGIYVHIPFCSSRCDYCAFATWVDADDQIESYVNSVLNELAIRKRFQEIPQASSLYFGGGTPSLLPAKSIASLIDAFDLAPNAEITIECNPESTTFEKLKSYRSAGINRISFGLQSLSRQVLASLGRSHNPRDIYSALRALCDVGIENYSVDLIYGAKGERLNHIEDTLNQVMTFELKPMHISAYALTVEQGTPLARDKSRYPDEDYQADAYVLIDEFLRQCGYTWYEISNWAIPGNQSRHNWNYWMQGDYVGLGCASHSHVGGKRSWNIFNLNRYILTVSAGMHPEAGNEILSQSQRVSEALDLLIRTRVGIPSAALVMTDELEPLVVRHQGRLTLTSQGRLLANQVIMRIDPNSVSSEEITLLQHNPIW